MAGEKPSPGWLRRVQRGFRQVRRWWWRHADDWPLSALRRYGKALVVLILWLLTALGLFRLIQHLLSDTLSAPSTEGGVGVSKEAIALLGSLLTALIGFGLQQWKGQEEDERRRQEQIQQALSEIQEFAEALPQNLSEGIRQYLKYRRRGGVWQKPQVRDALSEAWEKVPGELRRFVAIVEHLPEARNIGTEEAIQASGGAMNLWTRSGKQNLLRPSEGSGCPFRGGREKNGRLLWVSGPRCGWRPVCQPRWIAN